MIKVILWDVDGTLLDFKKAEYAAIQKCFEVCLMGLCTDEMVERYSVINKKYWERLERGEMTKPEILVGRFREFFASEGLEEEKAEAFNREYQLRLGDTICFCDDSYSLLQSLKGIVKQYAVTNGTKIAQSKKLERSGFDKIFDDIFISEEIGAEKPNVAFFEHVWEKIGNYKKEEIMIVGDSLTSDMRGGNRAGILCCWYNPERLEKTLDVKVDYEIRNLQEILTILKEINV